MRSFIAGMVVMAAITAGTAEARRHHRGGHGCRIGQILIRHTGECIPRTVAAREGIIGSGRRRLVRYASVEQDDPAPQPPKRPRIPHPEVVPPEPEVKCTDWNPNPVGWPGRWVYDRGLMLHTAKPHPNGG